jgi:hypothetical protein
MTKTASPAVQCAIDIGMRSVPTHRKGKVVLWAAMALTLSGPLRTYAADQDFAAAPSAPAAAQRHHAGKQIHNASLDDRVQLLARELDLDGPQQVAVRRILEGQREQVIKVWADSTVPAAYRVSATQAIGNGTADQIRGLLTEAQRKKYSSAARPKDRPANATGPTVEDWIKATNSN